MIIVSYFLKEKDPNNTFHGLHRRVYNGDKRTAIWVTEKIERKSKKTMIVLKNKI
jgi:hypothetical protein